MMTIRNLLLVLTVSTLSLTPVRGQEKKRPKPNWGAKSLTVALRQADKFLAKSSSPALAFAEAPVRDSGESPLAFEERMSAWRETSPAYQKAVAPLKNLDLYKQVIWVRATPTHVEVNVDDGTLMLEGFFTPGTRKRVRYSFTMLDEVGELRKWELKRKELQTHREMKEVECEGVDHHIGNDGHNSPNDAQHRSRANDERLFHIRNCLDAVDSEFREKELHLKTESNRVLLPIYTKIKSRREAFAKVTLKGAGSSELTAKLDTEKLTSTRVAKILFKVKGVRLSRPNKEGGVPSAVEGIELELLDVQAMFHRKE